jgi:capsular polysaccharide export protein
MIHDKIIYPAPGATLIGFRPHNDRISSIMRGLAGARGVRFISHVGVDPRPAPIREGAIEVATTSAKRQARGGVGKAVKRAFLRGQYNWSHRHLPPNVQAVAVCWNGLKGHRYLVMEAARANGHATCYLEEAPLPGRITVDLLGINAGSSLPKDPEFYTAWHERYPGLDVTTWNGIRADLKPRESLRRSDVQQKTSAENLFEKPYIFCPLQVPGDTQITVYGDWIASVSDMIDKVIIASRALPEGWHLRIKEHPSADHSFSAYIAEVSGGRVVLDNETNTMEQVAASRAVITTNSSVGFESLFFDKPVIVLGSAFYEVKGVVQKAGTSDVLERFFARPETLTFDRGLRDAFMSYVTEAHFPIEDDVVSGRVTLETIIERDHKRDDVLTAVRSANPR